MLYVDGVVYIANMLCVSRLSGVAAGTVFNTMSWSLSLNVAFLITARGGGVAALYINFLENISNVRFLWNSPGGGGAPF